MKFLKGLALGLIGFLLFPSLVVFGSAFTLNSTILNPNFLVSELDKLDVSSLTEEILSQEAIQAEFPEEVMVTLLDTIAKLEPVVKEQIGAATYSVYDYLLGKKQNPNLALTLGNTFFSSDFVISLMDELDMPSLVETSLSEEELPEEVRVTLVNAITELEPQIKERVGLAADPIFDYLLGESQSLDLALILHDTVLTPDFVVSIVDKFDISSLVKELLTEQLTGEIPEGMEALVEYVDDAITEEWVEEQVNVAILPVVDYLLGQSQSLSVLISLETVMQNLEEAVRADFLASPPAELAHLSQAQLGQYFDEYFGELAGGMPSVLEIDETMLGDIPAQIAGSLAEAEGELEQARQSIAEGVAAAEEGLTEARLYVGYFQLGYKVLIGFILLLILGIVAIDRQVRSVTRRIGSVFLTFAVPACLGIFAVRYFAEIQAMILQLLKIDIDVPARLQELILQSVNNFLAPLWMLSLGLLIAGVILIVVSFVYKPRQPSD